MFEDVCSSRVIHTGISRANENPGDETLPVTNSVRIEAEISY